MTKQHSITKFIKISMVRLALLISIFFTFTIAEAQPKITVKVAENGWAQENDPYRYPTFNDPEGITKVLESVVAEITSAFSYLNNSITILVKPSTGDIPMTLYKRGDNGEFIVLLTARNRRWAQFTYQFAHEFCHVLTMNKALLLGPNIWFEESLCDVSSMYALRAMAKTWKSSPPPNLVLGDPSSGLSGDTPSELHRYAQDLITNEVRKLPKDLTFIDWFKKNQDSLRANPIFKGNDRDELVASQLLPFFENYPAGWEAVTYLNHKTPNSSQTFEDYFRDWRRNSPRRYRPFIKKISKHFGIN